MITYDIVTRHPVPCASSSGQRWPLAPIVCSRRDGKAYLCALTSIPLLQDIHKKNVIYCDMLLLSSYQHTSQKRSQKPCHTSAELQLLILLLHMNGETRSFLCEAHNIVSRTSVVAAGDSVSQSHATRDIVTRRRVHCAVTSSRSRALDLCQWRMQSRAPRTAEGYIRKCFLKAADEVRSTEITDEIILLVRVSAWMSFLRLRSRNWFSLY